MKLFFIRLFSFLPLPAAQLLGRLIGQLIWIGNGKERQITEQNIRLCFPELSLVEQQAFAKASLREGGQLITEFPLTLYRSADYWREVVDSKDAVEVLKQKIQQGRGLVLLAPHIGNWEIGIHALTGIAPLTVLYRPPRQTWLESILTASRGASGATLVPTTIQGIRALFKTVKQGDMVIIMPDQIPRQMENSGSVESQFFGHPVRTMTLVSKLVGKTQPPVIGLFCRRMDKGFKLITEEAKNEIYAQNLDVSVQAVNALVERCISQVPTQYQWSYKRFPKWLYQKEKGQQDG